MSEALDIDFSFSRPIPGEGLTAELGARPWQNPPQFSTVDEALGYYIPRMAQEDFTKSLINVMEMGVPLTSLSNTIMLSGVMEGKHSVDVGILIMPSIIETMKLLGDAAGVEYDTGMEKNTSTVDNNTALMVAEKLAASKDDVKQPVEEMTEEPVIEDEIKEPLAGLMARRN
jgi:hypothetical protein